MHKLTKQIGPVIFISGIIIINILLWSSRMQAAFLNNDAILTSILGSTLLMGFFLVFLLSTRMQWLVKLFGGLENLYFWHRILAIATTAMIFIHQTLAYTNITASQSTILILGSPRDAGELARNGFILLVLITLITKFLK
ncbi:MAG TPA: hypothetical protein PKU69_04565, partial [Bacillota bacterium]|nr:hypothetical protein [Bacillota bacterium]